MNPIDRLPWTSPVSNSALELDQDYVLAASPGDPWGHATLICRAASVTSLALSRYDGRVKAFVDGPLEYTSYEELVKGTPLPIVLESGSHGLVCDDPIAICSALAPEFVREGTQERLRAVRDELVDPVYALGALTDQAAYEKAHAELRERIEQTNAKLESQRFLGGAEFDLADVLLFAFSIRLDPVYFELYKASFGLLADFPALEGHAQDLFERAPFYSTTDFDRIKSHHYLVEPVVNSKGLIPRGGRPDLDAPHFRDEAFGELDDSQAVEEDQDKSRVDGEWVRPHSEERHWIQPDSDARYPAEAGRYHVYAPYNCPWSHRALLGRAVLGLEDVVGASVVYFRRDPERGWQFNPAIPGCTDDRANDFDYIEELYESVGSDERSVPVLWDTKTETIVSNESSDILRMFSMAFDDLAERDIELYPAGYRDEIDRLNGAVYQRINNGAYKAGFSGSQAAYERAFDRYFRALEWLESLLGQREWLAGTEAPTEADLRLFPTVFRHDAVYYARFKLNQRRISDFPKLSDWLARMMEVPGVSEASDLDHARNGYFGRTGNEIVPAGPVPLELSPKDFSRDVWLNRA
jgi:putative glutathione S-transferase